MKNQYKEQELIELLNYPVPSIEELEKEKERVKKEIDKLNL